MIIYLMYSSSVSGMQDEIDLSFLSLSLDQHSLCGTSSDDQTETIQTPRRLGSKLQLPPVRANRYGVLGAKAGMLDYDC